MILCCGMVFTSSTGFAIAEYTRKKNGSVACHMTAKPQELNATSKYYQEKKTLEGTGSSERKQQRKEKVAAQ